MPVCARAERPPDDRGTAPVVLKGTVEAVDERWDLETDYFQVSVRVQQVERGQAILPGEVFVVSCFRWSRPWPGMAGATGHASIPDVGDKIHLFAWPRGSGYEGNYPDWYDVIEASPRPWFVRLFDHRKFRVFCVLVGVSLSGFVAWRFWKKTRRLAPVVG